MMRRRDLLIGTALSCWSDVANAFGRFSRLGGYPKKAGGGAPPLVTATDTAYFAASGATWPTYGTSVTPPNVYFSDTNTSWYVWEGWDGNVRRFYVKTYNHGTGAWVGPILIGTSPLVGDDHGVPAIERDASGYVHLFGGAHASTSELTFHTNAPNDPSAWTQDTSIAINSAYPKPTLIGSTLWLFLRDNTLNNGDQNYIYLKTTAITSGVPTWSAKTNIIDYGTPTSPVDSGVGSRVYAGNHVVVGTDIHFVTTFADANDNYRQDIFYYVFDTTTGNIRNFDSSVTVVPGSQPISFATSQASFRIVNQVATSHFGNVPVLGFDTNNHPHVGYMDGPSGGPFNFMHVWHNGTSWQTPDTVGAFPSNNALHRFDTFGVIPLQSGGIDLYWITIAAAGSYTRGGDVSKRNWSGGTLGSASIVQTAGSTFALDCISMVRYASTSGAALARATFWEITGNVAAPSGVLRGFVIGDSGYIRRPFQTETNTLIAASGTTTAQDKDAIDELISTFKACGLWTTADLYYNFKSITGMQRQNWKNPGTFNLADVGGGPTFVANSHVFGNGTTTRLTSGFIPSTNNVAASQNNCGICVHILSDANNDNYTDAGCVGGTTNAYINTRVATGTPFKGACNNATSSVTSTNVATAVGWSSLDRLSSSTTVNAVKDGATQGAAISSTSGAVSNVSFEVCGSVASQFSPRQIRTVWYGAGISLSGRQQQRSAEIRYDFIHS